jgi:MFS superfamily sulfate permease-like transporter
MNRSLTLIAGLLGVLFLAIAVMYWRVPVGRLPSFFPAYQTGSAHIASKHAIGSLIVALVLFTFVWLQIRRNAPSASITRRRRSF